MVARKGSVKGAAIQSKALTLAAKMNISREDFGASGGWLTNFQKRHGIKEYVQHGEAGAADLLGVKHAQEHLPIFIEREVSYSW